MYDGRNIFKFKNMIEQLLRKHIQTAIEEKYHQNDIEIQFQKTRKEFDGDVTLVVFPISKFSKKSPELTAEEIGCYLKDNTSEVISFNVVKGFLNLSIDNDYYLSSFHNILNDKDFGFCKINDDSQKYVVEYSSPNTNKPLHLGHVRNVLLGYSVAEILKASGKDVKKVQVINDRGIHICKSMVAWQDFGNNESPQSSGIKGDHFVGKYYIKFDVEYKKEVVALINNGMSKENAEKKSNIFIKAQEMLLKWEAKDKEVIKLWKIMNGWVYEGFEKTYSRIGVDFDKNYYESDTYLLGKEMIKAGLKDNIFFEKSDGSVWIDLTDEGLDEKILLRSDGTSVYMTQDIGTAIKRHDDFNFSHMVYTVANEQDYHFKVLFKILEKLGYSWAKDCFHLSYGMVDLPSGKMKSREGTVVDADDLMSEMVNEAKEISQDLGKTQDFSNSKANDLYETVGLGALKYFMLKIDPKKRMLFDPKESIDFNGNTGPFIQYTYARICSLIRKSNADLISTKDIMISQKEKDLIKILLDFPKNIQDAANIYSPAILANYIFEIVKEFNSYYQSTPILNADSDEIIAFRINLSKKISEVIKKSMNLLGINVPEKM